MANFERGDVVKFPFPYTNRATRQHRPALVVSAPTLAERHGLLWVLMITSAENRGWPEDVPVNDLAMSGLPAASVVRCAKIATIEARGAQRLGRLDTTAWSAVERHLAGLLARPLSD